MFVAGFLGSPSMNFVHGTLQRDGAHLRFESKALQADVSAYPFAQAPADGQSMVLGIRPEHLRQVSVGAPHQTKGTVGLIEPMGANKIAWVDAQGTPLAIQVEPMAPLTTGELAHLALDAGQLSLFDAASEHRL
jgi:multiple sugar transport system ATP-binding protein